MVYDSQRVIRIERACFVSSIRTMKETAMSELSKCSIKLQLNKYN